MKFEVGIISLGVFLCDFSVRNCRGCVKGIPIKMIQKLIQASISNNNALNGDNNSPPIYLAGGIKQKMIALLLYYAI
ncbi:hypothetical protein C2H98_21715 [Niallia circulans]|uniref:Uncharacterized protein n=1 Tax=Niallia circulans TaxID=1397 RepID=A0AA91Z0M0_NIACI|nr:hypothetical protein C2H98_21715 [Niallia circulans]PAD82928.1 hypothetical protein CHH57_12095 [Niallia circulans]